MMKRVAAIAGAAVLLGLLILTVVWFQWTGPGPSAVRTGDSTPEPGASVLVRISAGMTLRAAADTLAARGLLKNPTVLVAGARILGKGRDLKAGLYDLPFGASARDLLGAVTTGAGVQVKVTIPEGLAAEEIAFIVAEALDFDPEDFLAAADSIVAAGAQRGGLLPGAGPTAAEYDSLLAAESARNPRRFHWCEGHLAPDTFLFSAGTDPARAADFLVTTQWARLDSILADPGFHKETGLAPQELVTLASIVEAEARLDEERDLIAAVYLNRLEAGWRLEADPTVAFILRKKGRRLFYKDLEVVSAFNTYRNKGVPPGPIGSPGQAALRAVARPDTSCRAMYFVSDGRGGHVFSETAREHEAAVQEFRRIRARESGARNH